MTIHLSVQATDGAELHAKLASIARRGSPLTDVATDELVEELRRRMRPQGYVVNIDPVPALESGEAAATAPPPKRGRPAKSNLATTELAATDKVPEKSEDKMTVPGPSTAPDHSEPEPSVREQAERPSQSAETVEPVTGPLDAPSASVAGGASVSAPTRDEVIASAQAAADKALASEPASSPPTRDEVIAALNAYAAPRGGQVAGRTMMQEVCGVVRLQDIKPEDYPKLIAALKAAA